MRKHHRDNAAFPRRLGHQVVLDESRRLASIGSAADFCQYLFGTNQVSHLSGQVKAVQDFHLCIDDVGAGRIRSLDLRIRSGRTQRLAFSLQHITNEQFRFRLVNRRLEEIQIRRSQYSGHEKNTYLPLMPKHDIVNVSYIHARRLSLSEFVIHDGFFCVHPARWRLQLTIDPGFKTDASTKFPKGTCISILSRKHLKYLRRVASHYAVRRHVFRNHTTGSDDRVFSHSYTAKQGRTRTN